MALIIGVEVGVAPQISADITDQSPRPVACGWQWTILSLVWTRRWWWALVRRGCISPLPWWAVPGCILPLPLSLIGRSSRGPRVAPIEPLILWLILPTVRVVWLPPWVSGALVRWPVARPWSLKFYVWVCERFNSFKVTGMSRSVANKAQHQRLWNY